MKSASATLKQLFLGVVALAATTPGGYYFDGQVSHQPMTVGALKLRVKEPKPVHVLDATKSVEALKDAVIRRDTEAVFFWLYRIGLWKDAVDYDELLSEPMGQFLADTRQFITGFDKSSAENLIKKYFDITTDKEKLHQEGDELAEELLELYNGKEESWFSNRVERMVANMEWGNWEYIKTLSHRTLPMTNAEEIEYEKITSKIRSEIADWRWKLDSWIQNQENNPSTGSDASTEIEEQREAIWKLEQSLEEWEQEPTWQATRRERNLKAAVAKEIDTLEYGATTAKLVKFQQELKKSNELAWFLKSCRVGAWSSTCKK